MSGVELDRLWHWFGLAGLLCASAFFSGSETALFSLSRHELRQLGSSPSRLRRLPAELMRQPRRVLLTILIANMTVNVLIFADSYVLFERLAGQISAGLASAGGAAALLVVIIFGEVIPKA
ncbi:MAG: CNNM domain-containing protein, partial [Phycisphaerae bacterium]